jgi:hypothetical protein
MVLKTWDKRADITCDSCNKAISGDYQLVENTKNHGSSFFTFHQTPLDCANAIEPVVIKFRKDKHNGYL